MSRIAWWRHQMETFSALLTICVGNSPVPMNSPHKGQWRGALMFSLICVWINGWVNNREACDLRRHRGHYDVNVMVRSHRFESADQILERVLGYCVWKINHYHGRCRFFCNTYCFKSPHSISHCTAFNMRSIYYFKIATFNLILDSYQCGIKILVQHLHIQSHTTLLSVV